MALLHTPATILAKWLVGQAYASDPPADHWGLYISVLPEVGDDALCLYDTTGILQGRIQATGETIETHGIQLRVRSLDYTAGMKKAVDICDGFDGLLRADVTIDSTDYLIQAVTRKSPILPLVAEIGNKRNRFVVNFLASLKNA